MKSHLKFFAIIFFFAFFIFTGQEAKAAGKDLLLESLTLNPGSVIMERNIVITAKVKNNGTENITTEELAMASYIFGRFQMTEITYPNPPYGYLEPGQSDYITVRGIFTSYGSAGLDFKLDPNNAITETSETNNSIRKDITVLSSGDDLYAESITVSPANPEANQTCLITVKIKNNGVDTMNSTSDLGASRQEFANFVSQKNTYPTINLDNPVTSGAYFYYIYEGYFKQAGNHLLSFALDVDEQVEETNEDNNLVEKSVSVQEKQTADLSVEEILINIDEPLITDQVEINVKVKNAGTSSLTSDYGLTDYDSLVHFENFGISSQSHGELPTTVNPFDPGEILTYTYKGGFTGIGDKLFAFTINQYNRLAEGNIANNIATTSVSVYINAEARDAFLILNSETEDISSTSVKVIWQTDKNTTGKIVNNAVGTSEEHASSATGKSHSVTLSDLLPGTTYSYQIIGQNNSASREKTISFTTPISDNLIIKNLSGPTIEANKTIKFFWQTNLLSSGEVYYKLASDENYSKKTDDSSQSLTHNLQFNLTESGQYQYYLKSTIPAGTVAQTEVKTFSLGSQTPAAPNQETAAETENEPEADNNTQGNQANQAETLSVSNQNMYNSLKGKILLKVEDLGKAYYVNPKNNTMHYLGRPDDAFSIMRAEGIGITNANLDKIPVALGSLTGADSDSDGLSDLIEDALGTDKLKADSDSDGYSDKVEVEGNFNPAGSGTKPIDSAFASAQKGKIFLQVEKNGEAWYINPADSKRYFL
ncbi:MAG: hypothetical protein COV91_03750, partial [Candidatus Taylorbacteria bacterium CG11_big_fil_rev_8_21_14_0_20_46_11]